MFDYLYARHSKEYFKLGMKYWTTPKHVWKLAHGKHAKNGKDRAIQHELLDLGIIHRHSHSRNAEDYDMTDN